MYNFVMDDLKGSEVTIGITGLPVVITGEVVNSSSSEVVALKIKGGNKVYIKADLIAFVI